MSLNNVERVEVLKGPQGTLFGRNATGGLIQIVTRDPTQDFTAGFSAGYGNYDTFTGSAYVAGGIARNLAADIAAQVTAQGDGYGINVATGNDVNRTKFDLALRSKWVFTPSDATDHQARAATMPAHRQRVDQLEAGARTRARSSAPPMISPHGTSTPTSIPISGSRAAASSLNIEQDLGGVQLQSITAYRKSRYTIGFDTDLTPTPGPDADLLALNDRQISQELKLQSGGRIEDPVGRGRLLFQRRCRTRPERASTLGGPAIPPPPAPPITRSPATASSRHAPGRAMRR